MRILLASPVYDDSFADNVGVTLEAMGHEVIRPLRIRRAAYSSLPSLAWRTAIERLRGDRPSGDDLTILGAIRDTRPAVVLALTKGIHAEVLAEAATFGARRVIWWGDPPANNHRWGFLDPGWDLVLAKDQALVTKLRLIGRNAHLLHEAMNPAWHREAAGGRNESLAVVGNSYAFRQAICVRLLEHGVPLGIFGPRPPAWSDPRFRSAHSGRYVVREEKSKVFGEALGCLNTFQPSEGDCLNCRAFEIAGAAGLQLVEYLPALEHCFDPGAEVLPFRSFEELLQHVERARNYPQEADRIRQAGARRALAEHTYRHRLEHLIQLLSAS